MANILAKRLLERIKQKKQESKERRTSARNYEGQSATNLQSIIINEVMSYKPNRIPLPKISGSMKSKSDILAEIRNVNETYPLISTLWKNKRYGFAFANIKFNALVNQLFYNVVEPMLDKKKQELIKKTILLLHERLEIDFDKLGAKKEVYAHLNEKIEEIWKYLGANLSVSDKLKVKYYIFRDTIGLGKIEPLMRDPNIEDISCDGTGLPVFIFHRNPIYGEMPTNIWFDTKEELESFAMKLAQKCGRTISVAFPLLDAALPDGSRVQITYGTDIARKGCNFSIRKFFKIPLTPLDIVDYQTADALMLAYLWLAIEEQQSILVAGSTASGKTTFLNMLCQFIHPSMKIVSIEDTAELMLLHVNWVPQVARSGFGPKKYGEVTMYDLLKAALRQRPDYMIVGEVRGREADIMFHSMATGHPCLSTLHADNMSAVIDRLTTRPINLPIALLEHLDIIVFLEKVRREGKFARKVSLISEIEGFDREKNKLLTNNVFTWMPAEDLFVVGESEKMARIARKHGWTKEELNDEITRRAYVLNWMKRKKIRNFRQVWNIINLYYIDFKKLEKMMGLENEKRI